MAETPAADLVGSTDSEGASGRIRVPHGRVGEEQVVGERHGALLGRPPSDSCSGRLTLGGEGEGEDEEKPANALLLVSGPVFVVRRAASRKWIRPCSLRSWGFRAIDNHSHGTPALPPGDEPQDPIATHPLPIRFVCAWTARSTRTPGRVVGPHTSWRGSGAGGATRQVAAAAREAGGLSKLGTDQPASS